MSDSSALNCVRPVPVTGSPGLHGGRSFSRRLLTLVLLSLFCAGCRWTSTGQNALGVQYHNQGLYTDALQQFQTALTSDPSNPDAYYNLAATYHKVAVAGKDQRLIEQSESLYNQCLDLSPNHVDCHRGLAVLLAETGRPDSAMRLLKNWAAANPDHV